MSQPSKAPAQAQTASSTTAPAAAAAPSAGLQLKRFLAGMGFASHEAAHVVQQRGGVSLSGGVGKAGDSHEQHADAVADAATAGRSAEGLLSQYGGGGTGGGVQQLAVQLLPRPGVTDGKLGNLVKDLYKGENTGAPIGDGSTADAIREETKTNAQVGGRWHSEKGRQYTNALNNWVAKNPGADPADVKAAKDILADLADALSKSPR